MGRRIFKIQDLVLVNMILDIWWKLYEYWEKLREVKGEREYLKFTIKLLINIIVMEIEWILRNC